MKNVLFVFGVIFIVGFLTSCSDAYYEKEDGGVYYYHAGVGHSGGEKGNVPREVKGVDFLSFKDLGCVYGKDDDYVYFSAAIVEGADPLSFQPMDCSGHRFFGKDKDFVYAGAHQLPGYDSETFELFGEYYSKDAYNVYYFSDLVEGADPATISFLSEPRYVKDKNKVYYDGVKIEGADSSTVTVLDNSPVHSGPYLKDDLWVYHNGERIEGLDSKTFEFLIGYFASDKNGLYYVEGNDVKFLEESGIGKIESLGIVYSGGTREVYKIDDNVYFGDGYRLEGVDAETFFVLNGVYSKDKNGVYSGFEFDGQAWVFSVLEDADPATFELMMTATGDYSGSYGRDVDDFYCFGENVTMDEMDVPALEIISDNWGAYLKDNDHVYCMMYAGEMYEKTRKWFMLEDADPMDFKVERVSINHSWDTSYMHGWDADTDYKFCDRM